MADNAFDRTIINPLEKPLSQDINQALSQLDYATRMNAMHVLAKRASSTSPAMLPADGFLPGSMMVVPDSPASMDITIKAGLAFKYDITDVQTAIDGIVGLDDRSPYKPLVLMNDITFTVPTAPGAGDARIDIIEVRINRETTNATSRLVLDPDTGAFAPDMLDKTLAFVLDGNSGSVNSPADSTAAISYKKGVAAVAGTEVEPTVTAGYMKVCAINVAESVTTIDNNALIDRRAILMPGGVVPFSAAWRVQWNAGDPIHTLMHMNAPPGIQLCLIQLGLKGAGTLYILGGEIAGAAFTMTVAAATGFDNTDKLSLSCHSVGNTTATNIASVTSGKQTSLEDAGTVPPVNGPYGIGAKVAQGRIISRFLENDGTSNNTNAALEDAIIQVSGILTY